MKTACCFTPSPTPSASIACQAFGASWIPAPISPNSCACSRTSTRKPLIARPSAAANPPMPPPAITIGIGLRAAPNGASETIRYERPGSSNLLRERQKSLRSMTLLVFLTAAARARVVAADLVSISPDGLGLQNLSGRRHLRLALLLLCGPPSGLEPLHHGDRLGRRLPGRSRGFDRLGRGVQWLGYPHARGDRLLLLRDLDGGEPSHGLGLEAAEHGLEKIEALLLVFLQRVLLPVTAQPDPLLQMIHVEKVILPQAVERLQHDDLLDLSQDARREIAFLGFVELTEALQDVLRDRPRVRVLALLVREGNADRELADDRVFERFPVPLSRRRVRVDDRRDGVFRQSLG